MENEATEEKMEETALWYSMQIANEMLWWFDNVQMYKLTLCGETKEYTESEVLF